MSNPLTPEQLVAVENELLARTITLGSLLDTVERYGEESIKEMLEAVNAR
jgi:hypothetical protein